MANSVQIKVAEKLKDLAAPLETRLVEVLTERELKKRTDACLDVMDQLDRLEIDLRKFREDSVLYDAEGTEMKTFTKAKFEERKKLQEKIDKYLKAIEKALTKQDFNDVYNLRGQGSNKDKGSSSKESEGETS